jgi:hypothetical protein
MRGRQAQTEVVRIRCITLNIAGLATRIRAEKKMPLSMSKV